MTAANFTEDDVDRLWSELSNWGRWGDDDERGALNHLTDAHRAHAATLVRDGVTVSLARNLAVDPAPEMPHPVQHHMITSGDALDRQGIPGYQGTGDFLGAHVHGLGISHVDALCHMFVKDRMYNDRPPTDVTSAGAKYNTVMTMADGVVGRGVLLDIAGLRGVDYLEPDDYVTLEDLAAAEAREGVTVGTGDILMIATGRENRDDAVGFQGLAGVHAECLPWLRDREIAMLGSDGITDPMPGLGIPNWPFPIHMVGIAGLGIHLVDNMALRALGAACAERNRWEFLFVLSPLRVIGGTGCPVNPVAVL
jgi:kynurenine formamidase